MSETTEELIAYCGLYCKDCIRYRNSIMERAQALMDALTDGDFERYVTIKRNTSRTFEKYDRFMEVLRGITQLRCDHSCRVAGGCSSFDCQILRCCREKRYEGCWECGQLDACDKFEFLEALHGGTPKENCSLIRQHGLSKFEEKRYPFYIWDTSKRSN